MLRNRKRCLQIANCKLPLACGLLLIANCLLPIAASAQKDTLKKTSTIDINSAYKPVLRNAVKINFSATHLNADTTAPSLTHSFFRCNGFLQFLLRLIF